MKTTAPPFISLTLENGSPISVSLSKRTNTFYEGTFSITLSNGSGTATAILSARDMVNNRGTNIVAGKTILIDTTAPDAELVDVQPSIVIKNDPLAPVEVSFTAQLTDTVKEGTLPKFFYHMSQSMTGEDPVEITDITPLTAQSYTVKFNLPETAGQPDFDYLNITYEGKDDLENTSTYISGEYTFLVYQGDLPQLNQPLGFTAVSKPGGYIDLNWYTVTGAADYAIYRGTTIENLSEVARVGQVTQYTDLPDTDGTYYRRRRRYPSGKWRRVHQ